MLSPQSDISRDTAFGGRVSALADRLAESSDTPDGLTCTYLGAAHRAVAAKLCEWMRDAGMTADIDAVGNVVGRLPGTEPGARTLIVGSHYDTVVDAGKYDGRLGILTPLVVVEHLRGTGPRLPYNLEVIAFAEEEGVRFATPYIGSSAVAGRFDMGLLARRDQDGVTLGDALRDAGFDPAAIPRGAGAKSLLGYIEIHIEQGPVLLQENLPAGIVTAIAGAARFAVTVTGVAGHAGTVPMGRRRDAARQPPRSCSRSNGAAARSRPKRARWSARSAAWRVARRHQRHSGTCELTLDVRASDDATRDAALADIFAEIDRIAERRGVRIRSQELLRTPAVPCAPRIQTLLAEAVGRAGVRPHRLASGAGHDAVMFDGLAELGMLFVRCGNGGVSHSPHETVSVEDAELAARVLHDVLLNFPSRP